MTKPPQSKGLVAEQTASVMKLKHKHSYPIPLHLIFNHSALANTGILEICASTKLLRFVCSTNLATISYFMKFACSLVDYARSTLEIAFVQMEEPVAISQTLSCRMAWGE